MKLTLLPTGWMLAAGLLAGQTAVVPAPTTPAGPAVATLATNQLGLDLLQKVAAATPGGNVLLSPFSIQNALAMTYAGADGATRTEMARVLHYPADDAPLAASFAGLRAVLDAAAQASAASAAQLTSNGLPTDSFEWHMANRLFGQTGYAFREPFLAVTRDRFGAPLQELDFKSAPEPARATINAWVEQQTNRKIVDLIPMNGLGDTTRLVLVNALYLKAPWQQEFVPRATTSRPFQIRGTESGSVPTMMHAASYGYAKHPGFTAVSLPYRDNVLQFLILLPDNPAGVEALASQVTSALLLECANLPNSRIQLYLPKFKITPATIKLSEMLQSLGLKQAFDRPAGSANFDRMAPRTATEYLYIAEVFHKTFLSLDEKGTEAAAATAVSMMAGSARPAAPPIVVQVDHPFLFAIQLRASGACLFLGRVTDPR
jgi:serpin B